MTEGDQTKMPSWCRPVSRIYQYNRDTVGATGCLKVNILVGDVGPSGVRALPLAAGKNEGGHYFRYFSTSSLLFFFSSSLLLGTAIQNHRRVCRRNSNFQMGS